MKKKAEMMPFNSCPVCGGEMVWKEVEKLLRGALISRRCLSGPMSVCGMENDCTRKKWSAALSKSAASSPARKYRSSSLRGNHSTLPPDQPPHRPSDVSWDPTLNTCLTSKDPSHLPDPFPAICPDDEVASHQNRPRDLMLACMNLLANRDTETVVAQFRAHRRD